MSLLLQPPSVALIGVSGSGKTFSIATYLKYNIEVFFLGTEPGAVESLLDACAKLNLPLDNLHYHQMNVVAPGWDAIEANIKQVGAMTYEALSTLKDIGKSKMAHLMELLTCCKDFPCDRTGKKFGDATTWGASRAFVVDSLSGINKMAREYVVGYKPTMHQGEWGTAMQLEENLLYKLLNDRACFFTLIAHVDREVDEVLGGTRITMAALGRKLAPQLAKYFSEIILAKRVNDKFYWSTSEANADVKNRAMPIGATLAPDFGTIVLAHRERVRASQAATVVTGGAST